jgi:hypothetical protein
LNVAAADLVNFPEGDVRSTLIERTRTMPEPDLRELLRSLASPEGAPPGAREPR